LKDNDLIEEKIHLSLGPEKRAMMLVQLRKVYCSTYSQHVIHHQLLNCVYQDVEFLKRMKIMDYSLLIGIHDSRQEIINMEELQRKQKTPPARSQADVEALAQKFMSTSTEQTRRPSDVAKGSTSPQDSSTGPRLVRSNSLPSSQNSEVDFSFRLSTGNCDISGDEEDDSADEEILTDTM